MESKLRLANLVQFDYINPMITLSMITLTSICYKFRFLLITNPGYNEQIDLVP